MPVKLDLKKIKMGIVQTQTIKMASFQHESLLKKSIQREDCNLTKGKKNVSQSQTLFLFKSAN